MNFQFYLLTGGSPGVVPPGRISYSPTGETTQGQPVSLSVRSENGDPVVGGGPPGGVLELFLPGPPRGGPPPGGSPAVPRSGRSCWGTPTSGVVVSGALNLPPGGVPRWGPEFPPWGSTFVGGVNFESARGVRSVHANRKTRYSGFDGGPVGGGPRPWGGLFLARGVPFKLPTGGSVDTPLSSPGWPGWENTELVCSAGVAENLNLTTPVDGGTFFGAAGSGGMFSLGCCRVIILPG